MSFCSVYVSFPSSVGVNPKIYIKPLWSWTAYNTCDINIQAQLFSDSIELQLAYVVLSFILSKKGLPGKAARSHGKTILINYRSSACLTTIPQMKWARYTAGRTVA